MFDVCLKATMAVCMLLAGIGQAINSAKELKEIADEQKAKKQNATTESTSTQKEEV